MLYMYIFNNIKCNSKQLNGMSFINKKIYIVGKSLCYKRKYTLWAVLL